MFEKATQYLEVTRQVDDAAFTYNFLRDKKGALR